MAYYPGDAIYAKLFTSLYNGSMRGKSDLLLVFTNMLAHADSQGHVDMTHLAIAQETGLTEAQVEAAVLVLESPDQHSRSPEEDGRRVLRLDEHRVWGWRIVNYPKYRAIRNEQDRREQNRVAQQAFREKSAGVSQGKPRSAQAEAEAEADKPKPTVPNSAVSKAKARAAATLTGIRAIEYLNERAGTKFKPGEANLRFPIERILRDNATWDDLKAVIDAKVIEWGTDEERRKYLRPETLFNRTKFSSYVGQLGAKRGPAPPVARTAKVCMQSDTMPRPLYVPDYLVMEHDTAVSIARATMRGYATLIATKNLKRIMVHMPGAEAEAIFSLDELAGA